MWIHDATEVWCKATIIKSPGLNKSMVVQHSGTGNVRLNYFLVFSHQDQKRNSPYPAIFPINMAGFPSISYVCLCIDRGIEFSHNFTNPKI